MVPPELRHDPHVSFTQLDTYLRCPLRYRLQYVDRVEPDFVPAALALGSGIHGAAAFLFGTLDVLAFRAQIIGVDVPATILGMIPYVGTIVVLIVVTVFGLRRRLGAPDSLGLPYVRGER